MRSTKPLLALLLPLSVAVSLPAGPASAQTPDRDRSFEVQLFQSALNPNGFLTVETAEVPEHKMFGISLLFNYQRNPFTIYTVMGSGPEVSAEVVRNHLSGELTGAIGLIERFQLGFSLPVTFLMDGDRTDDVGRPLPMTTTVRASGVGDLRFEGKVRIGAVGPDEELVFAVAPGLSVPTGNAKKNLGDKNVTGRVRGMAELQRGDLRVGANLGVLFREPSTIFQAEVGQQLVYGAAMSYQFQEQVSAIVEVFGRNGFNRYIDANPLEADAALRISATKMLSITLGGGAGLIKGIGSPAYRGFIGAAWTPDFRDRDRDGVPDIDDRCPEQAEDRDGFRDKDGCPEPDNDGDGVLDGQDRCPTESEDQDQFQDDDGCPETDNDKDGIVDLQDPCPNASEDGQGKRPKDGCPSSAEDSDGDGTGDTKDKCPDDPEDRDGFEDEDGCPEPDNDNDGIPDGFDTCTTEAEDADGFEDDDGCPEPDNDKDGLADGQDKCPTQPETINGIKDDDGCPDTGTVIVRLGTDNIEVLDRIAFVSQGGRPQIKDSSMAVVNAVALVLRGHPEVLKLRIEVRAEGLSKEETQKRADAVRDALVARNVDGGRLSPIGMGSGSGRVDFLIETTATQKRKGQSPEPGGQPPQ